LGRDFREKRNGAESEVYDLNFDAVLIEQSIATQYGILPAAQGDLPYPEWAKLVGGLMDDTPLGRVVAVRAEQDPQIIAKMGPWQKRIRSEWQRFLAGKAQKQDPADLRRQMRDLEAMIARAFGGDGSG
jgi:hypothetical protein